MEIIIMKFSWKPEYKSRISFIHGLALRKAMWLSDWLLETATWLALQCKRRSGLCRLAYEIFILPAPVSHKLILLVLLLIYVVFSHLRGSLFCTPKWGDSVVFRRKLKKNLRNFRQYNLAVGQ